MTNSKDKVQYQCDCIADEVMRAKKIHPTFPTLHHAYGVIQEEVDEFWDLVKINYHRMDEFELINHRNAIRTELQQIAAACVRAIVDLSLE